MTAPLPPPAGDGLTAASERFLAAARPDVAYGSIETPIGTVIGAVTDVGLVRLAYEDHNGGVDAVVDELSRRVSARTLHQPARLDPVARELEEYFAGRRTRFEVPVDWSLVSPFGRRVLQATAAIPFGRIATYGEVARAAGSPKGSRAAGRALGANPVPIVVPCHRVVGASGRLVGYTGGVHRKVRLLEVEGITHPGA